MARLLLQQQTKYPPQRNKYVMHYIHFQNEMLRDLNVTNNIIETYLNPLPPDKILIVPQTVDKNHYKDIQPFLDKNGKFIINNLWEIYEDIEFQNFLLPYKENGIKFMPITKTDSQIWPVDKTFFVPMFFWYHSLYHSMRYKQKLPLQPMQRNYTHQFLMPMNYEKDFRNRFFELLGPARLQNSIYSYRGKGISLPNDLNEFNDRFVNIDWYKHTCYSVAVETTIYGKTATDGKFITEKTFKPIQYGHPFIVLGVNGILETLREHGFKTFPYLFDEKYDSFSYKETRMHALLECIDNFDKYKLELAADDVKHNYNRFYDLEFVNAQVQKEIINPIIEFTGLPIF